MASEDFVKRNDSFTCEFCGKSVPPAKKTSRNHCPYCLYSKHVDIVPGDRLEVCQGLMKPIDYDYRHSTVIILHKCIKCGKTQHNKAASDDYLDELLQTRLVGV
jgi:DNA-directed RNA polymerase subunit RPC12/RpoP